LSVEVSFVLTNDDKQTQLVTLYVTVTVSANTTPYPGKRGLVGAGEAMGPSMAQDSMKSTRSTIITGFETLSPITTSIPPADDGSAGMSHAKNALRNASRTMTTIKLSNTWEGALERIKWIVDTVGPVAEVRAMSFLPILD